MRSPITICYLANAASIHTQRWATHFAERGDDVHVISFSPGSIPGVHVHLAVPLIPIKQIGYPLQLPKIKRLLKKIRPDILNAHYATSYGLLGALTEYRPFMISAWGSDVLIAPNHSVLMRRIVSFSLQQSDLVTSVAHHMTHKLVELRIPKDKILTLPFGVDIETFHPGQRNQDQEDIDIVCTRHFEPIYNIELLIHALPHVVMRYPKVRCALVGDGSLRLKLKTLVRNLGIEHVVTWAGRIPLLEMPKWLNRAKVYVTPALSDGTSNSLNEAMACGCFPIASDIPANREWLINNENGFLVPPHQPALLAQRIIEALETQHLRLNAARINWEIVQERANWHKNITAIGQRYQRLVDQYRTPNHV